jgi:tetratricopeptide (TPR) repeat protein
MRTRLHLLAAFALVCAAAPAIAQDDDRNSNESDCANKQGAEEIAACTAWMQAGDLNEAEAAAAFEIRGSAYSEQKDFPHAIADFTSLIRLTPNDAKAFLGRANAYITEGDFLRAIADYGDVIRLDPSLINAFNNRAWAYYRLAKYARAVADYDAVVRRDPKNVQALYIRGLAEAKLGKADASKADIGAATAIDPDIATKFAKATGSGG